MCECARVFSIPTKMRMTELQSLSRTPFLQADCGIVSFRHFVAAFCTPKHTSTFAYQTIRQKTMAKNRTELLQEHCKQFTCIVYIVIWIVVEMPNKTKYSLRLYCCNTSCACECELSEEIDGEKNVEYIPIQVKHNITIKQINCESS